MTCVATTPGFVLACMLVGQVVGMLVLCSAFALTPQKLLRWIRIK